MALYTRARTGGKRKSIQLKNCAESCYAASAPLLMTKGSNLTAVAIAVAIADTARMMCFFYL